MCEPLLDGVAVWLCEDGEADVVLLEFVRLNTGLCRCAACADQDEVVTEWVCDASSTTGAACVWAVDALVKPVMGATPPAPDATDAV